MPRLIPQSNRSKTNATSKCARRSLGMDQRSVESVHPAMVCLGVDDFGDGFGRNGNLFAVLWHNDGDDSIVPTGWRDSYGSGISSRAFPSLPGAHPGDLRRIGLDVGWDI